jgi:L-ascorbate metabolism protein UlaG (beta-lactamase superfamily)
MHDHAEHADHDHDHGKGDKAHEGDTRSHQHGHHGHEAKEVVVPGASSKNNASEGTKAKMGPAEMAVTKGMAKAAGDDAHGAVGQAKGKDAVPCHCDHKGHSEQAPVPQGPKAPMVYGGAALGFVIEMAQGPTLFHAGDTDLFLDMGLIKRRYSPEVVLLPIGGHYTMGPKDAAMAASLLGAKDVVPMHYGTSPILSGTPKELSGAIGEGARVIAPRPGATIRYPIRH